MEGKKEGACTQTECLYLRVDAAAGAQCLLTWISAHPCDVTWQLISRQGNEGLQGQHESLIALFGPWVLRNALGCVGGHH